MVLVIIFPISDLLSSQRGQEVACYACIPRAEMPLGGVGGEPQNISSKFKRASCLKHKLLSENV